MVKAFVKTKLFPLLANSLSTRFLTEKSRYEVIHPFYHTVSDQYLPHIFPLYKPLSIREFEKHIDFLLKHFNPVDIHEVWEHQTLKKRLKKPSFHLSFDDGLKEVYEQAFPILYRKGIPFTVFVNTAFVDNQDLFYRYKTALIIDRIQNGKLSKTEQVEINQLLTGLGVLESSLRNSLLKIRYDNASVLDEIGRVLDVDFSLYLNMQRPYLTSEQLVEMKSKGLTIGAHSLDHPDYCLLSLSEQVRQTIESCNYVCSTWGEPQAYFSFPFTGEHINSQFFFELEENVDLLFGISGINEHSGRKYIDRIDMERYGKSPRECIHKAYLKSLFL